MAIQGTTYSDWLNQNEANVMQAGGYQQPAVAAPQVAPVEAHHVAPQPAAAAQSAAEPTTAQPKQDVWQQMSGMFAGQGGGTPEAKALRPSAFSTQVQSDAPNATNAPPMKGRAGKIMEIIGAVMSMGATKAMSQAQKNANSSGG